MSESTKASEHQQGPKKIGVGRATGIISVLTIVSRVLGLVRDGTIAAIFGAGMASDAFFVAFKIPNLLRRLVAEGSMATAFVPVLSDEIETSAESTRKAIGAVASCSLLITLTFTVAGLIWAEEITWVFAPGFGFATPKSLLASDLLRVLFPYVVIVGLLAITSSALQTFGYFALPAAAPAILNIAMIGFVIASSQYLPQPIYFLAVAVPVGGMAALLLQLRKLRKIGYPVVLLSPKGVRAVHKLLWLMLPAVLSASVYQLLVFVNTLLASLLREGSVTWLYFADRLFQFPLGVFSIAVATAVLPTLSRLASQSQDDQLKNRVDHTLGWITFITVPAAVGLIVLSQPIIAAIFQRYTFTETDSANTAAALVAYAIGLWPISCQTILVRCFLSKKNSITPAIISSLTLFVNIYLALALMGHPTSENSGIVGDYTSSFFDSYGIASLGHVGLALASSISTSVSMLFMLWFLPRVNVTVDVRALLIGLLRTLAAAVLMGGAVHWLAGCISGDLLTIIVAVPVGACVFFAAACLLKAPQTGEITAQARVFIHTKVGQKQS